MSVPLLSLFSSLFFFFNATAPTEIYTLSLHDALPICPSTAARRRGRCRWRDGPCLCTVGSAERSGSRSPDRKSTRLNSSHITISYAVFCLKKKKKKTTRNAQRTKTNKRNTTERHNTQH